MTDDQLHSITVEELRARFKYAPGYYLQSMLDRKKTLEDRTIRDLKSLDRGKVDAIRKVTVTKDKKRPNLVLVVDSSKGPAE